MPVTLRAQEPADLPLLTGGASPFDDFGPRAVPTSPQPPSLDGAGGLTVVTEDGRVAGDISWHWVQWGPNPGSRCPMIGIWLHPDHRGHGIGRDAQAQVAEQRALQAAGFQREGLVRGAQWRDGAHRDGFLYAILRGDPRPRADTQRINTQLP